MQRVWTDVCYLLMELWKGVTNPTYVLFSQPGVQRKFSRCVGCGRVFMHYWAVVTAADREKGRQIGCKCGGSRMREARLPVWQEAWFLLSRYVWRKLVRNETYWDPRLVYRDVAPPPEVNRV